MEETATLPPINQTTISKAEIEMWDSQLERSHGAKAKAITLSGLSHQTFARAMRGEPIKVETKRKINRAVMKVISQIQKPQAV